MNYKIVSNCYEAKVANKISKTILHMPFLIFKRIDFWPKNCDHDNCELC